MAAVASPCNGFDGAGAAGLEAAGAGDATGAGAAAAHAPANNATDAKTTALISLMDRCDCTRRGVGLCPKFSTGAPAAPGRA